MTSPVMGEIPLTQLLPIQMGVSFVAYDGSLPHKPVETVLYEGELGDPTATYILFDGHHRGCRAHLLGKSAISSRILTEDAHILDSPAASLEGCTSIAEARDRYRDLWLDLRHRVNLATLSADIINRTT